MVGLKQDYRKNIEVTLRETEIREPFLPSVSDITNPRITLSLLKSSEQFCIIIIIIPILQVANPRIQKKSRILVLSHMAKKSQSWI